MVHLTFTLRLDMCWNLKVCIKISFFSCSDSQSYKEAPSSFQQKAFLWLNHNNQYYQIAICAHIAIQIKSGPRYRDIVELGQKHIILVIVVLFTVVK